MCKNFNVYKVRFWVRRKKSVRFRSLLTKRETCIFTKFFRHRLSLTENAQASNGFVDDFSLFYLLILALLLIYGYE